MKKRDNKQRLFEVMQRLDKNFTLLKENTEENRKNRAHMLAKSEAENAVKNATDKWGMSSEFYMPISLKEFMSTWKETVDDKLYEIIETDEKNDLHEQGDETAIEDVKTGRGLSIGDVVKAQGLSGEYQVGMKISEGKPFLMPFNLSNKRANPYHRIYLTALTDPKLEMVLRYSDTDGGFVAENKINEVSIPEGDKRILTTYQTVTPESSEEGDYADQGWHDDVGESMIPDDYEVEDGVTAVDKAVRFLLDNSGTEPSSSHFNTGVWYSTPDPDRNYRTGEETYYSFHLKGFSPEEEAEIFNRIKTK